MGGGTKAGDAQGKPPQSQISPSIQRIRRIRQSRPDYGLKGLGLSHFSGQRLQTLLMCWLLAQERCPPRQQSRVERLKAKVETLSTQVTVENLNKEKAVDPEHDPPIVNRRKTTPFYPLQDYSTGMCSDSAQEMCSGSVFDLRHCSNEGQNLAFKARIWLSRPESGLGYLILCMRCILGDI